MKRLSVLTVLAITLVTLPAIAQITIGVNLSTTGAAASMGIPQKNATLLGPSVIAGQKIRYVFLDDASDPTTALQNVKQLVSQEKVDVILGPTVSPSGLAVIDTVAAAKTPMITYGSLLSLVSPVDERRRWVFKSVPSDGVFIGAMLNHMAKKGQKTLAIIAVEDALGESWIRVINEMAPLKGIKVVTTERFQRTDTSTTAQALRVIKSNADAVVIVCAGTPAVTPQRALMEQKYKGNIYHSTADTIDFLRVGGKSVEGALILAKPMIVAEQLPDKYPTKATGLEFLKLYEGKYGAGSRSGFAGHVWDAVKLLEASIPVALKSAKPGTVEFREALRAALENSKNVIGVSAVYNMNAQDHCGVDERGIVVVKIVNGAWKLEYWPNI